jgi:murein DD-endopeptidase MepM/ murein hydrolase activator NlpD
MTTMVACSTQGPKPPGLEYRVRRGDTLYRIGQAYGISHQELARENDIPNPDRIEIGQVLRIPHATRSVPVHLVTPIQASNDRPTGPYLPQGPKAFMWPVEACTLTSSFGPRGATHHDGVDIACEEGTPILAARAGRVLYADELRGYGNLVILEHGDGYVSVYAHNRDNHVGVGRRVKQGEPIGTVGRTGKTSGANLHFEIRKDNIARNPLFFLPPRRNAGARSVQRSPEGRGA